MFYVVFIGGIINIFDMIIFFVKLKKKRKEEFNIRIWYILFCVVVLWCVWFLLLMVVIIDLVLLCGLGRIIVV